MIIISIHDFKVIFEYFKEFIDLFIYVKSTITMREKGIITIRER